MPRDPRQLDGWEFIDHAPPTSDFLGDVLHGLSQPQKSIPAKYFYDARGSQLFEAICELPEYYPTRTELSLMRRHGKEMARQIGSDPLLIEYGSGSGLKTRILLDSLRPAAYLPIDISRAALTGLARNLARERPWLRVIALCADYSRPFVLPDASVPPHARRAVYFPGSTIGNFTREEMIDFLHHAQQLVGSGGAMLVGVDLKKAPALLHAAYNDAQGVTAQFNLNLLIRINRELGGNFDPAMFRHHAFYSEPMGRIEMHLVSAKDQTIRIDGRRFEFRSGETIHTENSCKYGVEEFQALVQRTGFTPVHVWVDERRLFSVHLLQAE